MTAAAQPIVDPPARTATLARGWRLGAIVYLVLMTVGTHWPGFRLGPEMPASDKTMHYLAYAGLTVLVWRAGWIPRLWMTVVAVGLWAVIDERTQALPGINRHSGWADLIADWLGVVSAAAVIATLGPSGGPGARWRHAGLAATLDRAMRAWAPWLAGGFSGGLVVATYIASRKLAAGDDPAITPQTGRIAVTVAAVVGAHLAGITIAWAWNRSVRRARAHGVCVACGADVPEPRAAEGSPDTAAPGACPSCQAATWSAAWHQLSVPRSSAGSAAFLPALIISIVVMLLGSQLVARAAALVPAPGTADGPVERLLASTRDVPDALTLSLDLTLSILALAVAFRIGWRRIARLFDNPKRCWQCGHDTIGAGRDNAGMDRCSECGTWFVRGMRRAAAARA